MQVSQITTVQALFDRRLDPSQIRLWLKDLYEVEEHDRRRYAKRSLHFFAEGTHFQCFRADLSRPLFSLKSLAIKLPKQAFLEFRPWDQWSCILETLSSLDGQAPLIPPFRLYTHPCAALIQPFGTEEPEDLEALATLEESFRTTLETLSQHRIVLGDSPHVRFLGSAPFLIDFSDLRLEFNSGGTNEQNPWLKRFGARHR